MPVESRGIFRQDNIDIAVRDLGDTPEGKAFAERFAKVEDIVGSDPAFAISMRFADAFGNEYKVSVSFRRQYQKHGEFLGMNAALALKKTVQYLVLNDEGFSGSWPRGFPAVPLEGRIKNIPGGAKTDAKG